MLENIKMLLAITDDSQDKLIDYYMNMCIQTLLNLLKLEELPEQLESCVERKVVQLMQGGIDGQRVTQIDRGDYKIKYEYDSSANKNLFSDMMGELKPFLKKVRFF
ncbi:MAG: phage head-tail connector protein [Peptostreptococcaceae bacterium]|jgi:DNA packaging protein, QLRG family|nr:phage head-tail connector protein [Peptostreptococcaceae bacterium]